MVERFNGRIADVLKTNRFDSALDLEQTLMRYVVLYNTLFAAVSPWEPNADAGYEGLAQVPPPSLRQITAQPAGTRQLGFRQFPRHNS